MLLRRDAAAMVAFARVKFVLLLRVEFVDKTCVELVSFRAVEFVDAASVTLRPVTLVLFRDAAAEKNEAAPAAAVVALVASGRSRLTMSKAALAPRE